MSNTRVYFLDYVRAVACFLVILIHYIRTYIHWAYPLIAEISKLSYGVYLIHMFVLVAVFDIISSWSLGTPLTMLLSAVVTFTTSIIITKIISLLPRSKYIIG